MYLTETKFIFGFFYVKKFCIILFCLDGFCMFGLCHNVSTNFVHSYKKQARCDGGGAKYKVMSHTLEQEPGIMKVLAQDRKASHPIPPWQGVDVLESVVKYLELIPQTC